MYIKSVSVANHPVIGTQSLSFQLEGRVLRTIILAGDNGSGKSALINLIFEICDLRTPRALVEGEFRKVEIEMSLQEFNSLRYPDDNLRYLEDWKVGTSFWIGFDSAIGAGDNSFFLSYTNRSGKCVVRKCQHFLKSWNAKRMLGAIYMDHDLHRDKRVDREDSNLEDAYIWKGRRSSEQNGYDTKSGLSRAWKSYVDSRVSDLEILAKMRSFPVLKAPSKVNYQLLREEFPVNRAVRELGTGVEIARIDEKKKLLLVKKGGLEFDFRYLSSGEKQILGITSFLTFDLGISHGSIVLIDEPENNLHPVWQRKLKDYFCTLFGNSRQIFIVTHSPFIIHEAKSSLEEKVFIFSRENGNVKISDSGDFFLADRKKVVNDAFSLPIFIADVQSLPIMFVEGETDEVYWKEVLGLFYPEIDLEVKWIGNYERGSAVFSGSSSLDKAAQFLKHRPEITDRKVVILYDCDENPVEHKTEKLFVLKGIRRDRECYLIGVENGLVLPKGFPYENFWTVSSSRDKYGGEIVSRRLNKKMLATHIVGLSEGKKRVILADLASDFSTVAQFLGIHKD